MKTFKKKFEEARENSRINYFGFEVKDENGEYCCDTIHYNEEDNTLYWCGGLFPVSIEVDEEFSVDENINSLYAKILESGYYDD
jgi:hypothetical protein